METQEYLSQLRKKLYRDRLRRRRRARIQQALLAAGVLCFCAALTFGIRRTVMLTPVVDALTVEAGTEELSAEEFLKEDSQGKVEISFITDMSEIDFHHVGEYEVSLLARGKEYTCLLTVEDTVAPSGTGVSLTVTTVEELSAEELVTGIADATDVSCSFKEVPDISQAGTVTAIIVLTDEGGNTSEVSATLTVVEDTQAPVIDGVGPLTVFLGDTISYKGQITVTDDYDTDVDVEVDTSAVDINTPGTYPITYTATDASGNTTEQSTTITIQEKPDDYVEEDTVYALADEVLAEITTEDMTLKQKAKAIYTWVRTNIGYVNTSEKDSWTNGAYQGFTQKSGDCFIFFSTAKALLTRAGIPNIDVVKSDTSHSSHYWSLVNVGDGWYHFDATPRAGGGNFFLLTDAELLSYSEAHNNSHIFDQSLYPATPTTDSTIE